MEIPQLASKEFLLQVPKIKINPDNSITAEGYWNWCCDDYPRPIYKMQKYSNNYHITPCSKQYFTGPIYSSRSGGYGFCSWPVFGHIIF